MWERLVLALLPLAVACTDSPTSPTKDVALGEEFELAPGESARISKENLTLTLEGVSNDSRCPVDVTCVWEGDATVSVSATQPTRERATLELHTSAGSLQEKPYGSYRVRLIDLEPQPRSGVPIPRSDYRARLKVSLAETTS